MAGNAGAFWLGDVEPAVIRELPLVMQVIDTVKRYRLAEIKAKSGREAKGGLSSRHLAATPTRFHVENIPTGPYMVIPEVSSERRAYIPMGYLQPDTLSSNKLRIVPNASLYHFGVLMSLMHMAWTRYVCGRMKSDYSYSISIVYNNYPWPSTPTAAQREAVEAAAQAVLDARANHPGSSLADLYDPLTMPADLVKAHQALDRAVDKCYRTKPFTSEAERVGYLFVRYEEVVGGVFEQRKPRSRVR